MMKYCNLMKSTFHSMKYNSNCVKKIWFFFNSVIKTLLQLRNKTCFLCLHSLMKTEANVWENSRADQ